jgi:hypothetical protein
MANYQVVGPLAIVKGEDGKIRYLYTGASVPRDLDKAQCDRLLADGLIGEVDASGGDVEIDKSEESAESKVDRPAQVAPREDWEAYVVSRGTPLAKAKSMSKPQLINAYPPE